MKKQVQIYHFNTKKVPNLKEVGGKALSLIKTFNAGFPVPNGFVLTPDFFNSWTKTKQTRTKQQEKILEEALEKVNNSKKQTFQSFSVRSSSPEEDLIGVSFAGMYETTLNVNQKELKKYILKSYLSAFTKRVADYKKEHSFIEENILKPQIAVIVQKMLEVDKAGVAFSINPANNSYDEAVINANIGVGENVVSGLKTPDSYTVDKNSKEILEKSLRNKRVKNFVLNDNEVLQVTELVKKVEKFYKIPIDIEWAFEKNKLYLLQARPITAYFKVPEVLLTKPEELKNAYMDTMIIKQGLIEPLSVLGADSMLRISEVLGAQDVMSGDYGAIYGGKTFTNVLPFIKLFGKERTSGMFGLADISTAEFIMDLPEEYLKKPFKIGYFMEMLSITKNIFNFKYITALFRQEKYYKGYLKAEKEAIENIKKIGESNLSLEENFNELLEELKRYFKWSLLMVVIAEFDRHKIKAIFKKESKKVIDKEYLLEMALPNNITVEMGLWMYRLSQYEEFKKVKTFATFEKKLKEKSFSREFLTDWNAFLDKHGVRAYRELDMRFPRIYEDLPSLWQSLHSMSENSGAKNPLTEYENTIKTREKTFRELYKVAEKRAKGKSFENAYNSLVLFGGYRESPKYFMVLSIAIIKEKVLKLAGEFVKQKRLKSVDEIFDLKVEDIIKAEKNKKLDLQKIRAKHLKEYETWQGVKYFPKFFDSRGKVFHPKEKTVGKNEIIGTPISPGVVRGKVKVFHAANEKKLLPGEILVTRATDPGWTPLFVNAGGILLEVGGVLQHGALVAREYGKPCIAGLEGIMNKLKDGQEIEMDGANGIVKIIK